MKVGDLVTFQLEMDKSVCGVIAKIEEDAADKPGGSYKYAHVIWNFGNGNHCRQRFCELEVLSEAR